MGKHFNTGVHVYEKIKKLKKNVSKGSALLSLNESHIEGSLLGSKALIKGLSRGFEKKKMQKMTQIK